MSGTSKVFSQPVNCEIRLNVVIHATDFDCLTGVFLAGDITFVDVSSFLTFLSLL